MHQLQALIETHQPDVIGLQETKVQDHDFPIEQIEAMGYHSEFCGQKTHYGVAILSKQKPLSVRKGFASDTEESQKRLISCDFQVGGQVVTVINGYFPQGDSIKHETKFPAKRKFYADLMVHLEQYQPEQNVIVMGDINISPTDDDIGIGEPNRKRWLKTGKCSFQPEEREWLQNLLDWGFVDSFRQLEPDTIKYSWFDYRSKGFDDEPKRGLRIDVILASNNLAPSATESGIDYDNRAMEKPSDHAPIWTNFELNQP